MKSQDGALAKEEQRKSSGGEHGAGKHLFNIDSVNKKIRTVAGDLPLSPIMDDSFWEARRRHQTPKAIPRKAQNSVERQFRKNPFGKPPLRKGISA